MVARSKLVDVRPFRIGLLSSLSASCSCWVARTAGYAGPRSRVALLQADRERRRDAPRRDDDRRRRPARCPERRSGRSSAALGRRAAASAAQRGAGSSGPRPRARRRPPPRAAPRLAAASSRPSTPPATTPMSSGGRGRRARASAAPIDPEEDEQPTLFEVAPARRARLHAAGPDASCGRSDPRTRPSPRSPARASPSSSSRRSSHFGVDANVIGQISGPRVTRYELQLAPGTKVSKVAGLKDDLSYALATTEIRILAPIPGKQAVGVELPNFSPKLRPPRRRLRRPAADGEPARGLAREGHLRRAGLDRPGADAASPDRRHDRARGSPAASTPS